MWFVIVISLLSLLVVLLLLHYQLLQRIQEEEAKSIAYSQLIRTQNEAMRTYQEQVDMLQKRIELNALEQYFRPPANTFELAILNKEFLEESLIYKN